MAPDLPRSPRLTVDAVVLRDERVLLVRRGREPFKGMWALPGGFVDEGETTVHACLRELKEETGLEGEVVDLLGVYDDPDRDPRGHVVTIAYVVRPTGDPEAARAADDAEEVRWFDVEETPEEMASDHGDILDDALEWLDAGGDEVLAEEDEP